MRAQGSTSGGLGAARAALLIAFLLWAVGCATRSNSGDHTQSMGLDRPTTQVFLVRHAEKVQGVKDPSLTPEGRQRARALAHALADAGIDTIYSTEFARTRETAQAVAEVTGLEVQIFPVGDSGMEAFITGMAREIIERQGGRTVLVVGHSNTVPDLMRALGATQAADLTEKDYDNLFQLERVGPGRVRLLQLHYGAPSE